MSEYSVLLMNSLTEPSLNNLFPYYPTENRMDTLLLFAQVQDSTGQVNFYKTLAITKQHKTEEIHSHYTNAHYELLLISLK